MVDALRAEVAGLTNLLTAMDARVGGLERRVAASDAAAMDARLVAGSLTGTVPTPGDAPDAIALGAPIISRLADSSLGTYIPGRVDPFSGRANILLDPTLEQVYGTTSIIGTDIAFGRVWQGSAAFTGAGSPLCDVHGATMDRITGASGSSSALVGITFGWGVTGAPVTMSAHIEPASDSLVGEAPWLVSAMRVRWDADNLVSEGLTGTLRLIIVDISDVEVATSDEVALEAGEGTVETWLQCALAAPDVGGYYRPKLLVEVAADSIGGATTDTLTCLEWQLHESDTEDPPSFTPAIGSWTPSALVSFGDPDLPFAEGHTGAMARIEVYPAGMLVWYDENGDEMYRADPDGLLAGFPMFAACLSDDSTTSTTPTDIPDLYFNCRAGRTYTFMAVIAFENADTNQSLKIGFLHPGGGAVMNATVETNATTGAASRGHASGAGGSTQTTSPATTSADTNRKVCHLFGHYGCNTDGTFQLRYARSGAGTTAPGITVKDGSGLWVIQGANSA